jgi:hypothetical protein
VRRALSFSTVESLDRRNARESFFSQSVLDLNSHTLPTPSNQRVVDDDLWSFGIEDDDDDESSVGITFGAPPPALNNSSNTNTGSVGGVDSQLPPIHPSTPDHWSESKRFIHSVWSLSPIAKVIKESNPKSSKRASLPARSAPIGLTRKRSERSSFDSSEEVRHSSSNKVEEREPTIRYEFHAPRKGQLGLVIKSKRITGPIVNAVKDYSPLFGLVKTGDKIVEVDGKKTSQSTLSEITSLLAVRPGRRGSNLRIIIERSKLEDDNNKRTHSDVHALTIPLPGHSRDNSSSLENLRFIGDVDVIPEPPDDLMQSSYCSDQSI